jgi:hypothetical protein
MDFSPGVLDGGHDRTGRGCGPDSRTVGDRVHAEDPERAAGSGD